MSTRENIRLIARTPFLTCTTDKDTWVRSSCLMHMLHVPYPGYHVWIVHWLYCNSGTWSSNDAIVMSK